MEAGTRTGEQIAQVGGGIEICWEQFGDPADPPLVLVMGLAMQMTAWDEEWCEMLAGHGFRVIRFDNRDVGHSTHLSDPPPGTAKMLLGLGEPAYRLADMAGDLAGLLDHLEIERTHLVGASMGGMIAQQFAIDHPERVASLGLIMTGPGDRIAGLPAPKAFRALLNPAPNDRDAFVDYSAEMFGIIGSPDYPPDLDRLRSRALASFDRGRNPAGVARQLHAITTSPDRTKALGEVEVPTVVIHGRADPLSRPAAGKALAEAIPGARLELIEGMGHDLPRQLWPELTSMLAENAARTNAG